MKYVTLLLGLNIVLSASSLELLIGHYHNGEYKSLCSTGSQSIYSYKNDDTLLNMIADACLKSDNIGLLSRVIPYLKEGKASRNNAMIYSLLILKKRAILNYFEDHLDISNMKLPVIDHPLSYLYFSLSNKTFRKIDDLVIFESGEIRYEVTFISDVKHPKIIIHLYKDNKRLTTHQYW
jgi:hypothetical protein